MVITKEINHLARQNPAKRSRIRTPGATKEQGEFHFRRRGITAKICIHNLRESAWFVKHVDTQPSDWGAGGDRQNLQNCTNPPI